MRRTIVFLYENSSGFRINKSDAISGNVKIRVFDVVNNLKKYFPNLKVEYYSLVNFVENKIYHQYSPEETLLIMNKGCFQYSDGVIFLDQKGYVMVSDYIDQTPKLSQHMFAHISSSVVGHAYLSTTLPNVFHVIHGYDNDFEDTKVESSNELKMVYCGAWDNIHDLNYWDEQPNATWLDSCTWWKKEYYTDDWDKNLPKEELQKMAQRKNGKWLDIVKNYIKPQTFDWKNELRYYNCHIGLRRYDAYAPHKPFTKGFTAAAFRCPIVVDSFNVDAQYYLPSDYPLFSPIPGPVDTKEKIREVHSFVQSKYHTPEWDYAVECMENLYRKCNSKKVTQRWKTVFEKIENLL